MPEGSDIQSLSREKLFFHESILEFSCYHGSIIDLLACAFTQKNINFKFALLSFCFVFFLGGGGFL